MSNIVLDANDHTGLLDDFFFFSMPMRFIDTDKNEIV